MTIIERSRRNGKTAIASLKRRVNDIIFDLKQLHGLRTPSEFDLAQWSYRNTFSAEFSNPLYVFAQQYEVPVFQGMLLNATRDIHHIGYDGAVHPFILTDCSKHERSAMNPAANTISGYFSG